MTLTRAQVMVLLEPKLNKIWNDVYPVVPVEYTAFYNINVSKKATITDFNLTGLGSLRLKGEGENIIYDDIIPGNQKTYTPVRFALGYKVTQEVIDHELYGQVEKIERGLVKSAVDLQETIGALLINNGFGTTNADGFKGKLSFMVSHYKNDTDAWAIKGDLHDANFYWDVKPRGGMQEDFNAEVIARKIVEGFVCGHGEWRGWWGSQGG
jgi:hypothetical protein